MYESRSSKVQHAIADVHRAATVIVDHHDHADESIWRRLFEQPREPHLIDSTRQFVAALDDVLGVPAVELTPGDVEAIGKEVDRVVDRIEQRITSLTNPKDAQPFSMAIYVLRSRFEELTVQVAKARA